MARKSVGIQLPRQARNQTTEERFALELEALAPIADIVEIRADSPSEFAAGVTDMDAIITSWGLRIDAEVIAALQQATVIGVGSVGVDMVDIDAATRAGIVVTNVPDVFIEEVADHGNDAASVVRPSDPGHVAAHRRRGLVCRAPAAESYTAPDGRNTRSVRIR